MHVTNHQRKHVRGSSPQEEMKRGFERWMKGLRSIIPDSEDPATTVPKIEQIKEQNIQSDDHESGSRQQQHVEERWQDDGGNNG